MGQRRLLTINENIMTINNKKSIRKLAIISTLLFLPSCMKTLTLEEVGRKPTNQEAIGFVKEYISDYYHDSEVKNLKVKEPVFGQIYVGQYFPTPQSGWVICYQANGKNIYGAYTGIKRRSIGVQNMELKEHGQVEIGFRNCKNSKWIR